MLPVKSPRLKHALIAAGCVGVLGIGLTLGLRKQAPDTATAPASGPAAASAEPQARPDRPQPPGPSEVAAAVFARLLETPAAAQIPDIVAASKTPSTTSPAQQDLLPPTGTPQRSLSDLLWLDQFGCVLNAQAGWNCDLIVHRRDEENPPSERMTAILSRQGEGWVATFADGEAFAAMALVQLAPVPQADPMPAEMRGTWVGAGRGNFGMPEEVSFRVLDQGASFHIGPCRGVTTSDQRSGTDSWRVIVEAACAAPPILHLAPIEGNRIKRMKITLEVGGERQEITLRRISDHSLRGSRHPDTPFDILGLPFGTAAEFQTALSEARGQELFFGANVNGPGMSAEYSTMRRIPGAMTGTYGEAIGVLTLERTSTLPLAENPVVAVWRQFNPAPDDRPLFHEVVAGLLSKYGQPSFRGNGDRELMWFFHDETGALRDGDSCNRRAGNDTFNYLTYVGHAVNLASALRANGGCGISIQVSLGADGRALLSSMSVVVQDQRLAREQSVLRGLDITRKMLASAPKRERAARTNTPDL